MLNYIAKACEDTDYLFCYPREWNINIEQAEGWINRLRSSPGTLTITCYVDGEGFRQLRYQF